MQNPFASPRLVFILPDLVFPSLFQIGLWFFSAREEAMNSAIPCAHCGRLFAPDPRVKNQRYCGDKGCQRARKRKWQKEKLGTDPDYKANQSACQIDWHRRHPGYYRKYRRDRPSCRERNNLLQCCRNAKTRVIAKMDESKPAPVNKPGAFYLLPLIAKMDASPQKVLLIPIVTIRGSDCKRGLDSFGQ
jgi:hypothetical protein